MDPEFDFGISGALRRPITPKPNVPSQFSIYTSMLGRSVELTDGRPVYSYDRDGRHKSACYEECLNDWEPILAPDYARAVGEWTTFDRSPGVKQWAFRGMPVYRHITDVCTHSQDGSDVQGWQPIDR